MTLDLFRRLENRFLHDWSDLRHLDKEMSLSYNHRSTDAQHVYDVDLPGLEKKDVHVKIDQRTRTLSISGERKDQYEDDGEYHIKRVSYGAFSQSFTLPNDAELSSVKAGFKNGVLTVVFNRTKDKENKILDVDVEAD